MGFDPLIILHTQDISYIINSVATPSSFIFAVLAQVLWFQHGMDQRPLIGLNKDVSNNRTTSTHASQDKVTAHQAIKLCVGLWIAEIVYVCHPGLATAVDIAVDLLVVTTTLAAIVGAVRGPASIRSTKEERWAHYLVPISP